MEWAGLGWIVLGLADLGWAGLTWAELGLAELNRAGLGWAGLDWVGLVWAELGWAGQGLAGLCWAMLGLGWLSWAGLGWAGLGWSGLDSWTAGRLDAGKPSYFGQLAQRIHSKGLKLNSYETVALSEAGWAGLRCAGLGWAELG